MQISGTRNALFAFGADFGEAAEIHLLSAAAKQMLERKTVVA